MLIWHDAYWLLLCRRFNLFYGWGQMELVTYCLSVRQCWWFWIVLIYKYDLYLRSSFYCLVAKAL